MKGSFTGSRMKDGLRIAQPFFLAEEERDWFIFFYPPPILGYSQWEYQSPLVNKGGNYFIKTLMPATGSQQVQ